MTTDNSSTERNSGNFIDEIQYKELFNLISDAVFLIEKESAMVIEINPAVSKIYGYTREEVLKMHNYDFSAEPDQSYKSLQKKDSLVLLRWHKKKDGTVFPVEITATNTYWNGKEVQMAVIRDITERIISENELRESEEKYRSLITTMHEGVIMLDDKGAIRTCNESAKKILGLNNEHIKKRKIIHPDWLLIGEDGVEYTRDKHPGLLALVNSKTYKNVILGVQKPSGKISWINMNSEPLFYEDNKSAYAVVVSFTDITRQKETERQLRELNTAKDRMFSIIAHDLMNPFGVVLGFSEVLQNKIEQNRLDNLDQTVKHISDAARQVQSLLDNLLAWSRTQQQTIHMRLEILDIDELITDSLISINQLAFRKKQNIKVEILQKMNVNADRNMIQAVIRNLVSNAIKFTPVSGSITVKATEKDLNTVLFSVSDTGIGIQKEDQVKLFKAYNSFTSRGTENEKGTGLGLVICKEFVEMNHGKIWLESEAGKGSVFYFTLKKS